KLPRNEENGAQGRKLRATEAMGHVVSSPMSAFTESIRSIKTAVDIARRGGKSCQVIGVTSSLPNEGKSTIGGVLAQLVAPAGSRAILIDCDLRNPALTRAITSSGALSIFDLAENRASLSDLIWTDPATNLSFLPASTKERFVHTNEFLGSET